ncbi:cobalamin biosynthesis protein [Paucibacter sp. B51]|uniref:cobalamin biosynthesis protein n=1 Tax=Paucibacter sp. B51 TaxID=2993315 RepID=UPI0022EBD773|nr:cobalamin biosynthesis protein [Paucibacter sp. B51]
MSMCLPCEGPVVLGLGCDRGTSAETIAQAVAQALVRLGCGSAQVRGLASIALKADEAGLLAFAAAQGWPLHFFSAAELARVEVPNPSETVRRHTGTPSVSEAAALLLGGGRVSDLLLEKHKHRGADGRHATVSVARMHKDLKP